MKAEEVERSDQRAGETEGFLSTQHQLTERGDASGEEDLLVLLKGGDPEGLKQIKRRYHDKLYSVAYRICNNHPMRRRCCRMST